MRIVKAVFITLTLVAAGGWASAASASTTAVKSGTFAGYQATDPAPVTTFSGTLVVPTVTCPASGSPSIQGQVGLSSTSFGQPSAFFEWVAECFSGTVQYISAETFLCPAAGGVCEPEAQTTENPGDTVKYSMKEDTTKGTTTLSVVNVTEQQTVTAVIGQLPTWNSISVGTSFCCGSGTNITPIPSFTPIEFKTLKFNGALLSTLSPTKVVMYDGSTEQVATSAISATGSFSNTFKHA